MRTLAFSLILLSVATASFARIYEDEELAFLRTIAASYDDETPKRAYRDYLEEKGRRWEWERLEAHIAMQQAMPPELYYEDIPFAGASMFNTPFLLSNASEFHRIMALLEKSEFRFSRPARDLNQEDSKTRKLLEERIQKIHEIAGQTSMDTSKDLGRFMRSGFLNHLEIKDVKSFLDNAEKVFAACPTINEVTIELTRENLPDVAAFVNSPSFAHVRVLRLNGGASWMDFRNLIQSSPYATNLRMLEIDGTDPRFMRDFLNIESAKNLKRLKCGFGEYYTSSLWVANALAEVTLERKGLIVELQTNTPFDWPVSEAYNRSPHVSLKGLFIASPGEGFRHSNVAGNLTATDRTFRGSFFSTRAVSELEYLFINRFSPQEIEGEDSNMWAEIAKLPLVGLEVDTVPETAVFSLSRRISVLDAWRQFARHRERSKLRGLSFPGPSTSHTYASEWPITLQVRSPTATTLFEGIFGELSSAKELAPLHYFDARGLLARMMPDLSNRGQAGSISMNLDDFLRLREGETHMNTFLFPWEEHIDPWLKKKHGCLLIDFKRRNILRTGT